MILTAMVQDEGCTCIKCGQSPYGGIGMVATRKDGKRDVLMICEGCLFKAVIGDMAFERWLNKSGPPKPIPEPPPIAPRFFG